MASIGIQPARMGIRCGKERHDNENEREHFHMHYMVRDMLVFVNNMLNSLEVEEE